MGVSKTGKSDTDNPVLGDAPGRPWPAWARYLASAALIYQITAVLAAAIAAPPSSPAERGLAGLFSAYHHLTDQGYAYRYYAPEPGPTPVVTASIRFSDGRPEESVRLPGRGVSPRLRYQRQLALANHLVVDFETAKTQTGDGSRSHWARSYARHLCRTHPGAVGVTLFAQAHLIPDPDRVREALASSRGARVDLDAEEFFTTPERIGDYPCDGS